MKYLALLLELAVVFVFAYSNYKRKLVFEGILWGIQVPASQKQKELKRKMNLLYTVSLLLVVVLAVPVFISLLSTLFSTRGSFIGHVLFILIYAVLWIGSIVLGSYLGARNVNTDPLLLEETNASVLESLPIVQSVEAQIHEAASFVVSFEGIALVNAQNYCFALERYTDYRLGELTTPQEVALIGMYFVQKYHKQFKFAVDFERIPGTPGQVVTFIGPGGVYVGRTKGTAPQAIFKSYIFYRQK